MLDDFKTGEKGHLAMVKDPSDDTAIGLVTLEDIIEEIIQAEIVDETDIVLDNKSRKKRGKKTKVVKEKEFQMFVGNVTNKVEVSAQVVHAVLQFLSTSLQPFHEDNVKTDILRKLLNLDVFREIKFSTEEEAKERPILESGKSSEHFILLIEGKVEVQIGNEGYVFESGPFTSFGKQILESVLNSLKSVEASPSKTEKISWMPECTLVAKTDVLYLKLKQKTFRAAVLASKALDVPHSETVETHLESMMISQVTEEETEEKESNPLLWSDL